MLVMGLFLKQLLLTLNYLYVENTKQIHTHTDTYIRIRMQRCICMKRKWRTEEILINEAAVKTTGEPLKEIS